MTALAQVAEVTYVGDMIVTDRPTAGAVRDAVERLRQGHPVIVLDTSGPTAAGELVLAAETAASNAVAFMVRHSSGYVRVALPERRADALDLPLCAPEALGRHGIAYAVSVDATEGTTTGISAADRARTIMALGRPNAIPADFKRPGHVVPLRTWSGGLRTITARGEAVCDLTTLAGFTPVAAMAAVVSANGIEIAAGEELRDFARQHHLAVVTIDAIALATINSLDHLTGSRRARG